MEWVPVLSTAVLATLGAIGALAAYHKWYGSRIFHDAVSEGQRLDLAAEIAKMSAWFEPPGPGQVDYSLPGQVRELHLGQEQITADLAAVKAAVANQSTRLAQHLEEETALSADALEREKNALDREKERDKRIDTLFSKLVDPKR
jgi:hypothetical protein